MPQPLKTNKEQIVANGLSVTYFPGQSNEVRSLDNINFSIYEGEFIIFFGPSGCGKSTLLYSIANLEKFRGELLVEGKNITKLVKKDKVNYYRQSIGMVFQAYHLIPTLSVLQNVALPLVSTGVAVKERKARAMELLTRFGVNSQANKLPNELSGGQQQRVSICRAVINNPKILIADEPLGNLDSKSAAEVIELFKDINEKLGKTVILVTHDPTYLDIAHRVFFIKDGKLIDIKVNKNIKGTEIKKDNFGNESHSKEVDFLSNHYSKLKSSKADHLVRSFQARNIASMALTGFTSDELDAFRDSIEGSLKAKDNFKQVLDFLNSDLNHGGLGLDVRTAENITDNVRSFAKELESAVALPEVDSQHLRTDEIKHEEEKSEIAFRRTLFDELNVKLKHYESLGIIDEAILRRARGEIDAKELFYLLNQSLPDGAGLDSRLASKLVKRIEIWLIGHKG